MVRDQGHILLVDDEKDLILTGCLQLKRVGYQVMAFSDALAAWDHFQAHVDSVDLLLTDLTMPRMTGFELARQALACKPELPVIIWSGYLEERDRTRALAMGVREYLVKPISIIELAEAVKRNLS